VLHRGRLAPCTAHDVQGGFGKSDISLLLLQISNCKPLSWNFLQNGLLRLKGILKYEDKRDLSTRLAGNLKYQPYFSFFSNLYLSLLAERNNFTSVCWKHSSVTTFVQFFPLLLTEVEPNSKVVV